MSPDSLDRQIKWLACLTSVYILADGKLGEYVPMDWELTGLDLDPRAREKIVESLVYREHLLSEVAQKLALMYEGARLVEDALRDWVVAAKKKGPLARLFKVALPVYLKREWERFRLQSMIHEKSESAQMGWVDYTDLRTPFGERDFDTSLNYLVAAGVLTVPESWAATFTSPGLDVFENQHGILKGSGLPQEPDFEQFKRAWWRVHRRAGDIARYSGERFPTPPGTTWGELEIRFKGDDAIVVRIKGTTRIYHCSQLEMLDKRKAQPDVQWNLLRALSLSHGDFGWDHSNASPRVQKRRERLAQRLQQVFGIDSDPIEWREDHWKTKFQIWPE